MASRVVFELLLFLTPWAVFGMYIWLTRMDAADGKRDWPINKLFFAGIALAAVGWFVLIALETPEREGCRTSSRMVDGKIIPGEIVPCDHDLVNAGRPLSDDPGGAVEKPPQ